MLNKADKKKIEQLRALGVASARFERGRLVEVQFQDPRINAEAAMNEAVAKTLDGGPADVLRQAAEIEDDNNLPDFERRKIAEDIRQELLYRSS